MGAVRGAMATQRRPTMRVVHKRGCASRISNCREANSGFAAARATRIASPCCELGRSRRCASGSPVSGTCIGWTLPMASAPYHCRTRSRASSSMRSARFALPSPPIRRPERIVMPGSRALRALRLHPRPGQALGGTLALRRNRLPGSYFDLSATSRSKFGPKFSRSRASTVPVPS